MPKVDEKYEEDEDQKMILNERILVDSVKEDYQHSATDIETDEEKMKAAI